MSAVSDIAIDRASMRSIDPDDGHLRIAITPISKSNICPYQGKEIPKFRELGLDPERVYQLFRDPDELANAAPTFAGKPLLIVHKPQTAADHTREITVGSVGTEVVFEAPYLKAPLTVWDNEAIVGIQSGEQKQLSAAYFYDADMTPGEYEGAKYDGVMRNLRGNHLALVTTGRAGYDVAAADAALSISTEKDARKWRSLCPARPPSRWGHWRFTSTQKWRRTLRST